MDLDLSIGHIRWSCSCQNWIKGWVIDTLDGERSTLALQFPFIFHQDYQYELYKAKAEKFRARDPRQSSLVLSPYQGKCFFITCLLI
jgi:hypothetical protein